MQYLGDTMETPLRRFPVWDQPVLRFRCGGKLIEIEQSVLKKIDTCLPVVPPPPTPVCEFVWASGPMLLKFLSAVPSLVRGKRVLELGSGTGIGGIAAAAMGAREVVLTDLPAGLHRCKANLKRNSWVVTDSNVRVITLDWAADPYPALFGGKGSEGRRNVEYPDVILTADCVYDPNIWKLLKRTLNHFSGPNTKVLMVEGIRANRTENWFNMISTSYSVVPAHALIPPTPPTTTPNPNVPVKGPNRDPSSPAKTQDSKDLGIEELSKRLNTLSYLLKRKIGTTQSGQKEEAKSERERKDGRTTHLRTCGVCESEIIAPAWKCYQSKCRSKGWTCSNCDTARHHGSQNHLRLSNPRAGVWVVSGMVDGGGADKLLDELAKNGEEWERGMDSVDNQPEYQHNMYDSRVGMDFLKAIDEKVRPLVNEIYPQPSAKSLTLTGHFVRRYKSSERLSFRPHVDSSLVTVNLLLTPPENFKGCDLVVYSPSESMKIAEILGEGVVDTKAENREGRAYLSSLGLKLSSGKAGDILCFSREGCRRKLEQRSVRINQGQAVIHAGSIYHGVTTLSEGDRHVLILFYSY
ncbi:hypothetical protein AAMO2058_000668500 [Amorphochlora amoebiformis]